MWTWSSSQGLVRFQDRITVEAASGEEAGTNVTKNALARIVRMKKAKAPDKGICYIMRDMQIVLEGKIVRQIRDMFEHLIGLGKTIIIVSPMLAHGAGGTKQGINPTLEKQVSVVHYELPNENKIKGRIEKILGKMKKGVKNRDKLVNLEYAKEDMTSFAKALRGLTLLEVDNAISTSLTHLKKLHIGRLINEKRQLIARSDVLEFIDLDVSLNDVGGLDAAKKYLAKYAKAQSEEAHLFGVEPLRGVILTGVPGTGKSLFSKVIGKMWAEPLLRLDIGKVMTGLVGGSEGKTREVIRLV
jgi:hypothetical protein